jgi:hypothetical protein
VKDSWLPWERILWRRRRWGATDLLSDFRVFSARRGRIAELALQDVADVELSRSRLDKLLGTATVSIHARRSGSGRGDHGSVTFHRVRKGPQLAALIELLAGDPQASLDRASVDAALSWDPADQRGRQGAIAALCTALVAVVAVVVSLQSSTPALVRYAPDDPIAPNGTKHSQQDIVAFMEAVVMPWAREALAPIAGGVEKVSCQTCHGSDARDRDWQMPAVAALPEPHFRELGWELNGGRLDAQVRNAIYGYLAESDKQGRAAYMREVVLPGMARLLRRPPYDFTRSYEYNRTRAAFGCYHCHRVQ